MAYAENFHAGGFHSVAYGGHLYLMCTVGDVTIWRHIHVSKPTFCRSLLTQYAYSSTRISLNFCVIELNINCQRSTLGYRRRIQNYARIENAHKVRKYTSIFCYSYRIIDSYSYVIEVQQIFSFPFSLLRHYQMSECFYFNNCCFWARATVLSC